MKKTKSL
jgi:hypothetical protein